MGLPQTLAGTVGFIIAVVFTVGISASDLYPDESQNIVRSQEDFTNAMNRSMSVNAPGEVSFFEHIFGVVGLDGIYDFIRNFLSMLISFIIMNVQYLFFFVGISTMLPNEFYLLFALVSSGFIISILKLIFMSGD